ncbi:MAG: hypothetical protein ABJ301_20965, partial [Rhodopirellula bahusiensis]
MLSQPLFHLRSPLLSVCRPRENTAVQATKGCPSVSQALPIRTVWKPCVRHILAALLGVTFSFCSTLAAFCQPPADSPIQAAAFTRTVITVSLDGQTAEEAINQIVSQVSSGSPDRRWTWWRDGGVDPNKIVSL